MPPAPWRCRFAATARPESAYNGPRRRFPLDATERQFVLDHLEASRSRLVQTVTGLIDPQYRQSESHWSAMQCIEHVVLTEAHILNNIEKVLTREPEPEKKADALAKDELILRLVPLRGRKVEAPPHVTPKQNGKTLEELLDEFRGARARTVQFATETQADLRAHFFPHMVFGDLDCYQWLLMIAKHCERHAKQIEEGQAAHA